MRAKFGRDPTAGSKKVPFNFISRWAHVIDATSLEWAQVINATAYVLIVGIRYERGVGSVGEETK